MRLDLSAIGAESDLFVHHYDPRELAFYALSIGASVEHDLDFLYEGRGPRALPSYVVVPALAAVKDLQRRIGGDPTGVLHVGQRVTLARPLPSHGTLRTRGRISGIYDLRKFAQSTLTTTTEDDDGNLLAETEWVVFHTRDVAPGAEPPPKRSNARAPARTCDLRLRHPIAANQAALYRLNGDDNPLHIDPAVAAEAGYPAPILHGLCTFGVACLGLFRAGIPLEAVRLLEGQFRAPVFPGDVLVTELWYDAPSHQGDRSDRSDRDDRDPCKVFFRAYPEARPDEAALARGYAELASE